jgi:hypothetical protein
VIRFGESVGGARALVVASKDGAPVRGANRRHHRSLELHRRRAHHMGTYWMGTNQEQFDGGFQPTVVRL